MRSITWRLVRWYALILAFILIICGVAALLSMRYLLFNEAAREVKAAITTVKKTTLEEKNLDVPELAASIENDIIEIRITTSDGQILNSSHTLTGRVLETSYIGHPTIVSFQGHRFYIAGIRLAGGTLVQIARPLNREEGFLKALASVFSLLVLAGLLLAAIGGWMITRAALGPIKNFTQTARGISTTDLGRRIILTGPHDELYQLGETFNQMLDRLERGFHSQQEFLAAASHDLRTPLAVIKSFSDILNRWGKNDPAVINEAIPAIIKAVETMERLVNDLLLLVKIQASPTLNTTPLLINELAEEIILEAQAVFQGITIKLETIQPVIVKVDEFYLRRALWVLVDNAIKYNQPGGKVSIVIFVNNQGEAVLTVSDTGPGINAKDLPKIFDRFYRGDPSRSQKKGFGLGLSLAKEIVEVHRGRIEVISQLGHGSSFSIILPLKP